MIDEEQQATREALLRASDDLLDGVVPGPLTGLRLVELAGVKRHRLTHDNPDINSDFQRRARQINRTKPEVERLRAVLARERETRRRVTNERDELRARVQAYATALLALTDERDRLIRTVETRANVTAFPSPR
ncbi:hypothetical protein [uncultured Microbacterium sp.]|uniref:hypothetical protein n=1 Tax=uncultured Microbacterium sp. TaxID=191216 RepID=UPI0028E4F98D|nr:hypothetical protein [uncultured Microbacterium sp.]